MEVDVDVLGIGRTDIGKRQPYQRPRLGHRGGGVRVTRWVWPAVIWSVA